jgi:hypothetical protein
MPRIQSSSKKAKDVMKLNKEREKNKKKETLEKANQQNENEKRLEQLEEEKNKITTNLAQLETEYDKKNKHIFKFVNKSNIQTISNKINRKKNELRNIENRITIHNKTIKKKSNSNSNSNSKSNSKSNSNSSSKTKSKSKSKTSSGSNISGILRKNKKRKATGTTKKVQFKSNEVQYFDKNESVQSLMKGKRSKTLKSKTNSK